MAIEKGAQAPDFELSSNLKTDGDRPGKKIKLSDYRGKPVVLAFYPLDFSPTCTSENVCFRDDVSQFEGIGAQVLGVSVDSMWTHAAFADKLGLTYPLLADFHPKGAVAKSYGLYNDERGMSKRATVIVDKDGKVAWVREHSEARSDAELIEQLKALL